MLSLALVLSFLGSGGLANGGVGGAVPVATPRGRPNVLLVVVDDMGVDHVNFHPVGILAGNPAPTPFLSKMAAQSLVFTYAYGAPICSVSRACLLTGRYPFRHGVGGNVNANEPDLPLSEVTLPELMLKAGYVTGAFGKWHLSQNRDHPNLQGFRHFDGSMMNLKAGGGTNGGYYQWLRVIDGKASLDHTYATSVVAGSASAWIQVQNKRRTPWFAYVAFHAPHVPYDPPPFGLNPQTNAKAGDPDLKIYHGMIEALDTELERLLDVVDTRNTLVIFLGDNGTPGKLAQSPVVLGKGKKTPYEGGIRIPAMVWGAGVRSGHETGFVHLVDFYRTILDVAGAPPAGAVLDSVSMLAPGLPPGARWVPWRAEVFTEQFSPNASLPFSPLTFDRVLRDDRFKLIRRDSGNELYDLAFDPWEHVDLLMNGSLLPEEQQAYVELQARMDEILGS